MHRNAITWLKAGQRSREREKKVTSNVLTSRQVIFFFFPLTILKYGANKINYKKKQKKKKIEPVYMLQTY